MAATCVVGLMLSGVVAPTVGQTADPPIARPEAEMLLDLDLLRDPELTQRRPLLERIRLLESLRLLERLRYLESESEAQPGPAGERRREVR